MNRLERSKLIQAAIESQNLAHHAIELRAMAKLVRTIGEGEPEPDDEIRPEDCEITARTLNKIAQLAEDQARKIAAEGGHGLPPEIEKKLDESRPKKKSESTKAADETIKNLTTLKRVLEELSYLFNSVHFEIDRGPDPTPSRITIPLVRLDELHRVAVGGPLPVKPKKV